MGEGMETVTVIHYRGSGFYGNRPDRVIRGRSPEWHTTTMYGSRGSVGDNCPIRPAELPRRPSEVR